MDIHSSFLTASSKYMILNAPKKKSIKITNLEEYGFGSTYFFRSGFSNTDFGRPKQCISLKWNQRMF